MGRRQGSVVVVLGVVLASCAGVERVGGGDRPPREAPPPERPAAIEKLLGHFELVYLDRRSGLLSVGSERVLEQSAAILRQRPDVRIRIRSLCEGMGPALEVPSGDRLADEVSNALVRDGASAAQLSIVYCGDAPLDDVPGAVAVSQNVNAEFRVTWAGTGD